VSRRRWVAVVMRRKTTDALRVGFAGSAIQLGKKFLLGRDFRHPHPAHQILPRIRISSETVDRLWSLANQHRRNKARDSTDMPLPGDMFKQLEFANGIDEALSWHISNVQFEPKIPAMRKELKNLRRHVAKFLSSLPHETESIGHFLFETYTGETFKLKK